MSTPKPPASGAPGADDRASRRKNAKQGREPKKGGPDANESKGKAAEAAGIAKGAAAAAAKGRDPRDELIGKAGDLAEKKLKKTPGGKKLGESGTKAAVGAGQAIVAAKTGSKKAMVEGIQKAAEGLKGMPKEQAKKKVKQGALITAAIVLLVVLCSGYVGGGGLGNAFSTGANAPGGGIIGDDCGGNAQASDASNEGDPQLVTVNQTEPNLAAHGKWDKEQVNNARIIYDVGTQLGVPERGIIIALTTSIGEQRLHHKPDEPNDTYAAIGMFQQRPQSGWGRWEYIKNRWYAAANYYRGPKYAVEAVHGIKPGNSYELDLSGGPKSKDWVEGDTGKQVSWNASGNTGGGKGLMGIDNWESKNITEIIELVQVADAPADYWADQEAEAKKIFEHITGNPASDTGNGEEGSSSNPSTCKPNEQICYGNKSVVVSPPEIIDGWTTPSYGKITSDYGETDGAHSTPHEGTDIANDECTQVQAVTDGKVTDVGCSITDNHRKLPDKECDVQRGDEVLNNGIGGCGWNVTIEHANNIKTRYCHLVREPKVKKGDSVTVGQLIGFMGSTGRSTGPHLHFEAYNPSLTSGKALLKEHGIKIPETAPTPDVPGSKDGACPFGEGKKGGKITVATDKMCGAVYATFPKFQPEGGANCNRGGDADHGTGMACDFMTNHSGRQSQGDEMALGNQLADWAMKNAKAYGIEYIMWQHRIWSIGREGKPVPLSDWKWVEERGGATANHQDHVHISVCANSGSPPFDTCQDNGA